MPSPTQRRGGRAEQRAVFFLQRAGYHVVARHLTSRQGEIDILATKSGLIFLVEVKYRRPSQSWPAELSMSEGKIRRMVLTYQTWCQRGKAAMSQNIRILWLLMTDSTIREIHIQ